MPYSDNDVLRFALADHAFREAHAVTQHLLSTTIDPNSHLFSGSIAGIAVSYCRPFVSGNGLGPLQEAYRLFPNLDLQATHDAIVEARNKLAAHMDLLHVASLHARGEIQNHPGEVSVRLTMQGAHFETTATYLHPNRLQATLSLCDFQIARIGDVLASIGAELLRRNRGLGTLVFRVH